MTTTPRTRSRRSARSAGTAFERLIADYLATHWDRRIDRQVKTGRQDRGDIAGFATPDGRVIVTECKNERTVSLGTWWREVEQEAAHAGTTLGVIVHKRHGVGDAGEQWVTLTLDTLLALMAREPITAEQAHSIITDAAQRLADWRAA